MCESIKRSLRPYPGTRRRNSLSVPFLAGIAVWGLLLVGGVVAQGPSSASMEQFYQQARAAEARNDYAGAARHYESMLRQSPELHPLRANLGLMLYLSGDPRRAIVEFRRALAGDASLQSAWLFLGVSLLETGQVAEAIPALEKAVQRSRTDRNARQHLARAYYLAARHRDALRELLVLEEQDPGSAETLYLLGRVYLKLSLETYDRLKDGHPEHYRVYQILGENYALQAQYGPAIANYRKAIERNPKARGLRVKLGEVHEAAGDLDAALAAYQAEIELQRGDADAHERAGLVLVRQSRLVEALPHLEEAVRLAPNSVPALTALGRVQLDRGEAQAALAPLRRAVEVDPRNADAWFQLARAHQRVGDRAAARAALEQYEKHK